MTLKEFKHQFIVVENVPIIKKGTIEHAPIIIERVKEAKSIIGTVLIGRRIHLKTLNLKMRVCSTTTTTKTTMGISYGVQKPKWIG